MTNAYLAGLFDGEGSIGIYRQTRPNKTGYGLRTQLTQNTSDRSLWLMEYFQDKFRGNISVQQTISGRSKYNWQLNSNSAAIFLETLLPDLILKRNQAVLAILWQRQRPKIIRDDRGRVCLASPDDIALNESAHDAVKALKRRDSLVDLDIQADLVDIVHTLKPIITVKGDSRAKED